MIKFLIVIQLLLLLKHHIEKMIINFVSIELKSRNSTASNL